MPTREQTIAWEKQVKIEELKHKLAKTDYICNKLTEAICEYIIQGASNAIVNTYNEYKEVLSQRRAWRNEINALEEELQNIRSSTM